MSIVIASTSDTQQQVNEAAGITSGTPATSPEQAPSEVSEPEPADESDPSEEEPDDEQPDDSAERKPRRHSANAQQRIARLTRDKYQLAGRLQELERRLDQGLLSRQEQQQPTPETAQPPAGKPRQEDFPNDYDSYIEALTDWKAAQAYHQIRHEQEAARRAEQETSQLQAWHGRLKTYRSETPDFDAVMQGAEDIEIPPYLQNEIKSYEDGPQLAYALAKDPDALARIVSLPPAAALRELGRFEARQNIGQRTPPVAAVSKAPEPISPVGRGSSVSTKDPNQMSQQEYMRHRAKQGAWWAKKT
jgi:hypothetical protein